MYVLGEGIESDHEEGLRWLRLAAAQGEGAAMRLMADLYRNGYYGVPVDLLEAADWDRQYRAYEERRLAISSRDP
jgi:TPR repeat protein